MTSQINEADPRVKRTRRLLQEAFLGLMGEKSFRDITVQDITDRATVNRATFYAHYEDKYDLLDGCMRDDFRRLVSEKLPTHSAWNGENFALLIRVVLDFMTMMLHDCTPANREFDPLLQAAMQEEIAEVLLGWFRQPTFPGVHTDVSPETLATLWSWAIFGAAAQWSRGNRLPAAPEMTRQIALALTQSLPKS